MSTHQEIDDIVESKVAKKKIHRVKDDLAGFVWFGKKQKINGRSKVYVNEETDETDVLSLAVHSGISTDEALSEFMLNDAVLKELVAATKTALSSRCKITTNPDNTIVTRYYGGGGAATLPEVQDPRIAYHPSPDEKPSRWAIRGYLIATICSLLDDSQRVRVLGEKDKVSDRGDDAVAAACSTMITFRGQRRELSSIAMPEIEEAERDILTSHSVSLMRELVCIRRMLHINSENGLIKMLHKLREAEGLVRAEKMIRVTEIADLTSEKDKEIAARGLEVIAAKTERDKIIDAIRTRNALRAEEATSRFNYVMQYEEEIINLIWRLNRILIRHKQPPPVAVLLPPTLIKYRHEEESEPRQQTDDPIADLRLELEDAKLEIDRLKDDARGKAVPKPKAHRKTRDPDIYMATETDIKNSVRSYLSQRSCGSRAGTPMSSIGSSVAMRARRRVGVESSPGLSLVDLRFSEEREFEAARKLKALSRSREQDLCNAESASEQLADVIEALSSILTRVALTIEDVALRRTAILNHMRSLGMHGRSIASIIRERPYLLGLARRMNHERRPVVNLGSLRALINVSNNNLKNLREIETITLESVGGAFDVMSLEEAATNREDCEEFESVSVVKTSEEIFSPIQPPSGTGGGVLMRATLRRPVVEVVAVKPQNHGRGDGNISGGDSIASD